jgi:hypothetical protein
MKQFAVVAVATLIVGSAVWADIPPPPPAAGLKRVPVEYKVGLTQEFPESTFFLINAWGAVTSVKEIKLIPKEPSAVTVARFGTTLVAVPKQAVKGYATEKELHDAVIGGKVTGAVKLEIGSSSFSDIKKEDSRTKIVKEFIVEKIDPKEGIILRKAKKNEKGTGDAPEDEDPESASAKGDVSFVDIPLGGMWVAGVAAFLALTLGGLWLVRRHRDESHGG